MTSSIKTGATCDPDAVDPGTVGGMETTMDKKAFEDTKAFLDTKPDWAAQVIDLQNRLTFQEDAFQEMSRQMALQAQALQAAQQHIQLLNQKINDLFFQLEQKTPDLIQERPPHY